jgi:hypothetical protein
VAVQVLVLAALAAKWREPPRDALDTLVLTQADLNECDSCAPAAAAVLSSHLLLMLQSSCHAVRQYCRFYKQA